MGEAGDKARARQGRTVALVIAIAMLLWLLGQWLGRQLGLPDRYAFLFDFAAIAAFLWALIVAIGIWRKRQDT